MSMLRVFGWSPIVCLSWLWGFAPFFLMYIAFAEGWTGLAAFVVPYVAGLLAFAWLLGNGRRNPVAIFEAVQARYTGLFLACQILIIAATILSAAVYVFVPLFGVSSLAVVALVILLAAATGHSASVTTLGRLHVLFAISTVAIIVTLLIGVHPSGVSATRPVGSIALPGLFMPALVGLLLGPWTDVRQWQLATALHREHRSIRVAYCGAAVLFIVFAGLIGALAMIVSSGSGSTANGAGLEALLAGEIGASGIATLKAAYLVWAGVAIAATVATSYNATSWLLRSTTARSTSPLLAFIPNGIATSPLWFIVGGIFIAAAALISGVSVLYIVAPFATLFAGPTACLVCESVSGKSRYDGVLCAMIGLAALLFFAIGLLGELPLFVSIAPAIGLIGALPAMQSLFEPKNEAPAVPVPATQALQTIELSNEERVVSHGFDGQWFVLHVTPTYDDTNSVGNVYFANYFRWVGKTRELFFNACMPDFDLHSTSFFVLTKSFNHEFRREMREFQPLSVRVRIGSYNRKFVTIVHEIHSRTEGLVGRGEQTIMFVDTVHYRPIDIPTIILQRFLPYYTPNATGPKPRTAVGAPAAAS